MIPLGLSRVRPVSDGSRPSAVLGRVTSTTLSALQLRGATAVAAAAGLSGLARWGPLPLPVAAVSRWPHHRAALGPSRFGSVSGPESQLAVENE